jgi:hypothetical protein
LKSKAKAKEKEKLAKDLSEQIRCKRSRVWEKRKRGGKQSVLTDCLEIYIHPSRKMQKWS